MVIIVSGNYPVYKDLFTGPRAFASAVANRAIFYRPGNGRVNDSMALTCSAARMSKFSKKMQQQAAAGS